jgi:hypothetical protein
MLHLQELEKDLEGKTNLVGIVGRKGYSKLFWYRLHERLVTIQVQLLVMLHDLFSVQQKKSAVVHLENILSCFISTQNSRDCIHGLLRNQLQSITEINMSYVLKPSAHD